MRVVSDIHASVCSTDTWISSAPIILMGGRCEQPSVGRVGANPIKPIRPVRKRFPGTRATAFLVSRSTGCGNGLGGAWEFSPCDPCHASCCSMRVHRKHECKDPARVAGSIVDCADIAISQGWYPHMLS